MAPRRLVALAVAAALVPLGACENGSGSDPSGDPTAGTPSAPAAAPQASPAFREWPEVPAPPVGQMMSHTDGGFRQEAYYRADPAGQDVYQQLVDLYVDALSRIGEVERPPEGQREGETTLRVETPDGRTATVVVHTRGPEGTVDVRLELTQPHG